MIVRVYFDFEVEAENEAEAKQKGLEAWCDLAVDPDPSVMVVNNEQV